MNVNSEQLQQISSLFSTEVRQVLVIVPPSAKPDECAAAIGWLEVLRAQGKECKLISSTPPTPASKDVPGSEEITQDLGGENLVVSFPYDLAKVDKVSYHIGEQTGRFYLTIKPKTGTKPLDIAGVELGYAGASADILVYIGVTNLSQLEPYATEYADLFRNTPSLSLIRNGEAELGSVKLTCEGAASLSEESAQLYMQLGWEVPVEAATALLRGVEFSSDWLASPTTTANTFEVVAALLRAGARRLRKPVETPIMNSASRENQNSPFSIDRKSTTQPKVYPNSTVNPAQPPQPVTQSFQPVSLADAMKQRQDEWGIAPTPQSAENRSASLSTVTVTTKPSPINPSNTQVSANPYQTSTNSQPKSAQPTSPNTQTSPVDTAQYPQQSSSPQPSARPESSNLPPTTHHRRKRRRHTNHNVVHGYPGRKKATG